MYKYIINLTITWSDVHWSVNYDNIRLDFIRDFFDKTSITYFGVVLFL